MSFPPNLPVSFITQRRRSPQTPDTQKRRSPKTPVTPRRRPPSISSAKRAVVKSFQKNVWVAVKQHKTNCSDFSLRQRGTTCYMAAATLMFGRTVMDVCKVDDVRAYVRRSMGNAWDDAQGLNTPSQHTCPRIPQNIREYYAYLERSAKYKNVLNWFDMKTAQCVQTKTCPATPREPIDMVTHGGHANDFLVALMWASGIPCLYTYVNTKLHPTTTQEPAKLNFDYSYMMKRRNATFDDFAKKMVKTMPRKMEDGPRIPFHVLHFSMKQGEGFRAPQDSRKVINILNELVTIAEGKYMIVRGLLLSIGREGGGHAVSIYPCYVRGTLKWICCNTWGDNCFRGEFHDFIADLCAEKHYTHFTGFTLLIKMPSKQTKESKSKRN